MLEICREMISEHLPAVPRPPMGNRPKRRNGTLNVVTFGVMSRMTSTSSGFDGMSLDDMALVLLFERVNPAVAMPRTREVVTTALFVSLRCGEVDDVPRNLARTSVG